MMTILDHASLENAPHGGSADRLIEQKAAAVIALANSCSEAELDHGTRSQIRQLVTLIRGDAGRERPDDPAMSEREREHREQN